MSFQVQSAVHSDSLADVLERILEKEIVIAGDVSISLVGVELFTSKPRPLIATVDKAKELGIDWWQTDPTLSAGADRPAEEDRVLRDRTEALERRLEGVGA